jgi:GxxExxY protein
MEPRASTEPASSFNDSSDRVIGACIEVHRYLGPGLLESAYEESLCWELSLRGIPFERQKELPVRYKGIALGVGFRLDVVVANHLIVEVKAVERLLPVHQAQAITYAKLSGLPVALLVNFNERVLRHGLRRFVNEKREAEI